MEHAGTIAQKILRQMEITLALLGRGPTPELRLLRDLVELPDPPRLRLIRGGRYLPPKGF